MELFNSLLQIMLIAIIFTLTFLYVYLRWNDNYWKNRGIPYERPTLLFGSLSFVMRRSFTDYFYELKKRYPRDYVGVFLGWQPALVVQSPELARKILVKDAEYFQNRYCYASYGVDPIGSLNLFAVRNPIWTVLKTELTPMFTPRRLKLLTEVTNINADHLIRKIQRDHIDKAELVNLKELFSMYTSDTVAYAVFGMRVSALSGQDSPLWHITSHMVKWTFWRGFEFTVIFFIPTLAALLRLKFFSNAATNYLRAMFWNAVNERKNIGNSNDKDLVNHLIKLRNNLKLPAEAGTQFADDLMLAQAAAFILASIETVSTTLIYCVHELAHHPEEQEKLFGEIDEALKSTGKDVLDYEDLLQLKYLTACINETLRKYPPSPHLDRVCNETYQLNEDVTIEKGVPVFFNLLALHYNEEFFPQPEEWRPERMINTTDNDNMHYNFLPFGDGPRFCIGKRFGMMQVRAGVAQMIHKFRIEADKNQSYLVPSNPYSVILTPKCNDGRFKLITR